MSRAGESRGGAADLLPSIRYVLGLVRRTCPRLTLALALATVAAGALPVAAAYAARFVIDRVVEAVGGGEEALQRALMAMIVEGVLVTLVLVSQRVVVMCQALMEIRLAHAVRRDLLEKAASLSVSALERPEVQDQIEEARREAAARPVGMVSRSFQLVRYAIAIAGYLTLLVQLSPWVALVLLAAGVPAFISEKQHSEKAFRFFRTHSPENRERHYIELLLTREKFKQEVSFFGLGPSLVEQYDRLFYRLYEHDRRLATRRHAWGIALSALSNIAFFGVYAWIVMRTAGGFITLGQMTMYLVVFRQGQQAVGAGLVALGGIYEDHLYVANLRTFLSFSEEGRELETTGPAPAASERGLRVEGVSFTYPEADGPAISDISLGVAPGETVALVGPNGSGKSTLVRLLTGAARPSLGQITIDGAPLERWSRDALRGRVSVLHQEFMRYKLTAGVNIGVGWVEHLEDPELWARAAEAAGADELVDGLPEGFQTRIGKTFLGAKELSSGQWQRIALARAFARHEAGLLLFDEPTSALDPMREAAFFERLFTKIGDRSAVVVSHRMATARLADRIVVMDEGRIVDQGNHAELMARGGLYRELFSRQAKGYR